jgi:fumarate reductase flavoprotein subunit
MTIKVMDCDIVVMGAGGSGLVAGVKAFDLTGKKVVILEKTRKPAGCTYFASGMGEAGPIRDSAWHKKAGYEVSENQDVSGQFFDWLVSKGGAESYFSIAKPEENRSRGPIYTPDRTEKYKDLPDHSIGPGRMGSWVVDKLTDCCKKQGIKILTETRARKFIMDDKGKLTGVLADTGKGQLLLNCKACIVAAGGYGANKDLLKKYYPDLFDGGKIHCLCPPAITGDGILAAEEVGAHIDPTIRGLDFPGGFFGNGMMRHPWNTNLQRLQQGKCVIVNMKGNRWKNEGGMGGGGETIADQPGGVACAIVDSDIVETAESQQGATFGGSDPRTLLEDLESEAAMDDAGASGNHTKKADTIVELALKMKVDPSALVETIERYNEFCETGKDLDFGKSAQMLQKIKKPPFYAIFGNRWSQSTKGRNGIAVNTKFQALNAEGEVIPGLYAAGDGCTIFGGFVIGTANGGTDPLTEEQEAARASLSKDVAQAFAAETGAPQGGMPSGGGMPGGSGGAGGPGEGGQGGMPGGGQGGMPAMGAGSSSGNILEGTSSPCGGLGPAFLSGYCAGTFAAAYIEDL